MALKYRLFCFYGLIIQHIPLKAIYALATFLGHISYISSKSNRVIMAEELDNIFQQGIEDKEKRKIILKACADWMKVKTEAFLFPTLTPRKTNKIISIVHRERLDRALEQNKGVILLTFHFGAERMVLPALGFSGYKVNQIDARIVKREEGQKTETDITRSKIIQLEKEYEESLPVRFISIDNFMRGVLECLKRNEILVVAADGGEGSQRVPVPFLNRTAVLSRGAISLAKKTGAPILPIFTVRQKDNHHKLFIGEPVELEFQGDKNKDAIYNLEKFTRLAEEYIRKHPCHYLKYLWLIRIRLDKDPVPFFTGCLKTV